MMRPRTIVYYFNGITSHFRKWFVECIIFPFTRFYMDLIGTLLFYSVVLYGVNDFGICRINYEICLMNPYCTWQFRKLLMGSNNPLLWYGSNYLSTTGGLFTNKDYCLITQYNKSADNTTYTTP